MANIMDDKRDMAALGKAMYDMAARMYPICRSITGDGVRSTLKIVSQVIPLQVHEVPSGAQVFDWVVPREWNVRDAYVANSRGERVIDFKKHNLHVLNYSSPINATMSLAELKPHLFSLPDKPDWIPYRTSYYRENWGFCLSHKALLALPEDQYTVVIDSTLEPGALTYGEYYVRGELADEVLISCHICHPSLANDNLSGIALASHLARLLGDARPRYSYRFVFIPGTIGSIAWLSRNEETAQRIKHGLVVVCVGDGGKFTYKKSRRGNAVIDRAVLHVLSHEAGEFNQIEFYPYGYDERQYCSPGFNLAVGSLSRTTHGEYPQYHTSADDLDLISPRNLAESLQVYLKVVDVIEHDRIYINQNPKCEPQLGKRGLYGGVGATARPANEMALLWVLNLSDGSHSLLDIAERANMPFEQIKHAAKALLGCGLLRAAD